MSLPTCEHPAKVRTVVAGVGLLCSKCARIYFPPPHFCHDCGASKDDSASRVLRLRFRSLNGRSYCNLCAPKHR